MALSSQMSRISRVPCRRRWITTNPSRREELSTGKDLKEGSTLSRSIKFFTNGRPQGPIGSEGQPKVGLMRRVRDGVTHYWQGTKLLGYETKISSKLLIKVLRGQVLSRREYRQLLRTTSDLFRLVPFVVIVLVPFLEFALPVLLKLFPNMLPSTFEDRASHEEKVRKQVKVKLEMAKFLQETIEQMPVVSGSPERLNSAKLYGEIFRKARITGEPISTEELIIASRQLSDTITLENLPRPQLVSICRFLSINAFGTDNFLRYQIRMRMKKIKTDDELIDSEGIEALSLEELVSACLTRGIRVQEMMEDDLRRELGQWLHLSLKTEIPSVMLVLSKAFALQDPKLQTEEALQTAILSLPDHVVEAAELEANQATGADYTEYDKKLQVLETQQELIDEERAQESVKASGMEEQLTKAELASITEAVSTLASPIPNLQERRELESLKEEREEFKEDVDELVEVSHQAADLSRAAKIIGTQVERLIGDIEKELDDFEADVGSRLQKIQQTPEGQLSTEQLESIMRLLKRGNLNPEKIAQIIQRFDQDGDGKVFVQDIFDMAKELEDQEGVGVVRKDIDLKNNGNKK